MAAPLTLSRQQAARISVAAHMLAGPRPSSPLEVIEHLGRLQMDPTSTVARSERLVLFSRLGSYDVEEIARLMFDRRRLFEYWAFIVPMHDYPLHRPTMRRFPPGDAARRVYTRGWWAANAAFSRYVLRELRRRGPLRSRDLEDRAQQPWRTGGWNDGKNVGRMLDVLWSAGRIAIVGRDSNERIWDLAQRWYPQQGPWPSQAKVARELLERQLSTRGVARLNRFGFAFDGRPPGWEHALRGLLRSGRVVPVRVDGLIGEWFAHADALERPFVPRTTLLSPFDALIHDRELTDELFGFRYRLEIYQPAAERVHGYFVLPILHGDRMIGRIDPVYDRRARHLQVNAVFAEPDAPRDAGADVAAAIGELAGWLGASTVGYGKVVATAWRRQLVAAAGQLT
jgi:uncharacterized protein